MFKIEGLFLNDCSKQHLSAVKSLARYLDQALGGELTPHSLFSLQTQIYEIHRIGVDALTKTAMQERAFDCKAGCNHCCHATNVDITPAEAFFLADYVQQQRLETISPRTDTNAACPLLKDGLCTAYEARPLSCRYILSTELASCIKRRETLSGGARIPAPFSHFRTSLSAASFIVFKTHGLDTRWLTLDQAIGHIVDKKTTVEKWLAGEKLDKHIMATEPEGSFKSLIETSRDSVNLLDDTAD